MQFLRISMPVLISLIFLFSLTAGIHAEDQTKLDEFTVLMENLIDRITDIENAYSPVLTGNIARMRRLEVCSRDIPEIENIIQQASGRNGTNLLRLQILLDESLAMDPSGDEFLPVLEEMWVRSTVLECEKNGIGADVVADYIRRESSGFLANRGDFSHPDFDQNILTAGDHMRIYFCGFGLVVLVHMEGGVERAVELYEGSIDLNRYFGTQLVFRGVDLDVDGIPMLEAVLFDDENDPSVREFYFGMIAGKLIGPAGQFGDDLRMSDEWKSTVAVWVFDHIRIPERVEARLMMDFYGVAFDNASLGPESLLGLLGHSARTQINSLLIADDLISNVAGLEALNWFDMEAWPDDWAFLVSLAMPLMSCRDFTLAVMAKDAFDADARYTGEPYDEARRERLRTGIPMMCDLMNRALAYEGIDYIHSTAWADIYSEGTLTNLLVDCMPMVSRVIVSDWEWKQEGEQVSMPEEEVDIIAHFIPEHVEYFDVTSDAVLGFLMDELDSGNVNPFRIWTYVGYLEAAKEGGVALSDEWLSAISSLKQWSEIASAVINDDELGEALDELMQ